ncbi:MAG: hypothetical protein WBX07_07250, partial [Rhodoplanes sp.]
AAPYWPALERIFSCVKRYLLESMLRWKEHQKGFYTAKTRSGPRWVASYAALNNGRLVDHFVGGCR